MVFVSVEKRGGMADRGKGLALRCIFEDLRWKLKLEPEFQLRVGQVCLTVYEVRLQSTQIVICVLLVGLDLVGSPDHLQARALLAASGDFGRRMAVTRPLIGRRPHRRAAERADDAVRRLRIE